jgi:hypothetical protein
MFEYNIVKEIGVISEANNSSKELNLISFNGREPKYDVRSWTVKDGKKTMGKGITLTKEEAIKLREFLQTI